MYNNLLLRVSAMLHCHFSTVAHNGQTRHWLLRGLFVVFFYAAPVWECEMIGEQLVAFCNFILLT